MLQLTNFFFRNNVHGFWTSYICFTDNIFGNRFSISFLKKQKIFSFNASVIQFVFLLGLCTGNFLWIMFFFLEEWVTDLLNRIVTFWPNEILICNFFCCMYVMNYRGHSRMMRGKFLEHVCVCVYLCAL